MPRITNGTIRLIVLLCFAALLLDWSSPGRVDDRLMLALMLIAGVLLGQWLYRDTAKTLTQQRKEQEATHQRRKQWMTADADELEVEQGEINYID